MSGDLKTWCVDANNSEGYGTSPAAVLAYLKKHHNSRAIEISRGAGVPESSVYALLRRLPVVKVGRRMEARYSLATPEAAE